MKCNCNVNCIKNKDEILQEIKLKYDSCPDCYSKTLKKAIPIQRQINLQNIDYNYLKCKTCGKRNIDIVMAHVLKYLIEDKFLSNSASIRKVGTPLITPAIPLDKLPYLPDNSLVIITSSCDKKTADKILENVPEIKSIIKGDINKTVGILNEKMDIINYELLAGCDIRCDIQYTKLEPIIIYKHQSKIHIEYTKQDSPKILQLDEILEKYENPTVIDAMCGPGTLGIYAIQKNARKVLFNDIYNESLDSLKINLEKNDISNELYEITNKNILELENFIKEEYDVGIIDAFPNIDTENYVKSLEKICKEVIVI